MMSKDVGSTQSRQCAFSKRSTTPPLPSVKKHATPTSVHTRDCMQRPRLMIHPLHGYHIADGAEGPPFFWRFRKVRGVGPVAARKRASLNIAATLDGFRRARRRSRENMSSHLKSVLASPEKSSISSSTCTLRQESEKRKLQLPSKSAFHDGQVSPGMVSSCLGQCSFGEVSASLYATSVQA